ncbi:PepSY-like domain-containing protein [Tenacibaculum sp. UWU-22]|uniref:PepSY-like domain-containing protein n=1 Tax=Tenacibaculum sp. UWU-22 TaxID=3234187 RepID=UPI0034DAD78A
MKNVICTLLTLVVFGFSAYAQKRTVPEKAKAAFQQKYPGVKKVKWSQENEKEWEAEFKMNGKRYSSNFSSEGEWLEFEYRIKKSQIPELIKQTLDSEFSGYKIEKAEISQTSKGKLYEVELEKGKSEIEAVINTDGKVVKQEPLKEDND